MLTGERIERIPTDDFVTDVWQYQPGQHVSFIGPTGRGKTTLALKLATVARFDFPHIRAVLLAMKPDKGPAYKGRGATGDETVARLSRAYGGRISRVWPPIRWPWTREPVFWVYWPRHSRDPLGDRDRHATLFGDAFLTEYLAGGRIIIADELFSLEQELKLRDHLDTLYTKGRSMEVGIWGATQRPAHVTRNAYSMASHLFLWKDNDADARKRYAEISGVDPREILAVISQLSRWECLYLHPDHPEGPRVAILTG